MKSDSKDERKERARALREQIAGIMTPRPKPPTPAGNETPAEFIRRRMDEIEKKKDSP